MRKEFVGVFLAVELLFAALIIGIVMAACGGGSVRPTAAGLDAGPNLYCAFSDCLPTDTILFPDGDGDFDGDGLDGGAVDAGADGGKGHGHRRGK